MKRALMFVLFVLIACTRQESELPVYAITSFIPKTDGSFPTRASNPDELRISDYNLFIFNAFGDLEENVFLKGAAAYNTRLLRNVPYTIIAVANMGYRLPIQSLEEARSFRYHMAYPDEYSRGMPMAAVLENVIPGERMEVPLERLMARIDLSMDRSALNPDILVKVTDVSIGNCPSSVTLFPGSQALNYFTKGFTHSNAQADALNQAGGILSLYMLENCTGNSYIDIKAEYHSDTYHTQPGERITYSIPLEEIRRNTIYPITISIKK